MLQWTSHKWTGAFVVVACLVGLGMHTSLVAAFVGQETAEGRVRELLWAPGVSFLEQLLPDDQTVVISRAFLDVVVPIEPLTTRQVIDDIAVRAKVVAVLDVDVVDTVLAQGDSYVDTRLITNLREVWRSAPPEEAKGQRMEVHLPGGDLKIGKVLVRAGDGRPLVQPRVHAKRSYLAFLMLNSQIYYPIHPLLLIEGGKVRYDAPLKLENIPSNPLEGLTLKELQRLVREAKTSWVKEGNWKIGVSR